LRQFHTGYIYIDLKPSNIVVTKMPGVNILLANNVDQLELKLIDFAGALEYEGVDQSSRKNAPNVEVRWPLCSPYYAPPELTDEKKWGMPKKVGN
jgi:serine/threonine protein kinase